jgi:hypothetical protein
MKQMPSQFRITVQILQLKFVAFLVCYSIILYTRAFTGCEVGWVNQSQSERYIITTDNLKLGGEKKRRAYEAQILTVLILVFTTKKIICQ